MPGLINRFPRGLLGLLDAKTNGKTPEGLGDLVAPVLDVFPHYIAAMREAQTDTSGAIAGTGLVFGTNGRLTCPSDQIWYVDQFQVRTSVALGAGEIVGMVPVQRSPNIIGTNSDFDLAPPVTAGLVGTLARNSARAPFWVLPGDFLGALLYERTNYAGTVRLDIQFSRLQI